MDKNSILRWVLIAAGVLLFVKFGLPKLTGEHEEQPIPTESYVNAPDFAPDRVDPAPDGQSANAPPPEGELCTITTDRFKAELSTRGAALKHFVITEAQYANGPEGFDLSTTPDQERWRSLRTLFRAEGADDQLPYDRFLWKVEPAADGTSCTFHYDAPGAKLTKVIRASERPFELEVETSIENTADAAKKHRFEIATFAYRTNGELKGASTGLAKYVPGRVSPFMTDLMCASTDAVERKSKDDFKGGPFTQEGTNRFAAVTNYYFGQAIVPAEGTSPECWLLAEQWYSGHSPDDDDAAVVYHASLRYPAKELAPHEVATYKQTAFFGPKERNILASVGGGRAKLGELINLGFFSPVAKLLVTVLVFFHDHVTHSWGLAIILMTVCLKLSLFPLSLKQIRTTIGMRKLKPELDELAKKFGSDTQGRNLATMELYRKRGVSPLGGCLPQLVQMPIWWAMYTTLQTAVEMYHRPFLWFQDLSVADPYYILPLLLGGLGFLQARLMPQQPGQDPAQQRMMMYMMPALFTVMMLFLPAALGVYMMTNSLLGIVQQTLVEQYAKRAIAQESAGQIVVKEKTSAGSA